MLVSKSAAGQRSFDKAKEGVFGSDHQDVETWNVDLGFVTHPQFLCGSTNRRWRWFGSESGPPDQNVMKPIFFNVTAK